MADEPPSPVETEESWLARFPARFQRRISQGAYRPEVDGLRFFAIAFVIFGHSVERAARFFASYRDAVSGGALEPYLQIAPLGVYLFFSISGFILANQAIKANKNPLGAPFLKAYFGRRVTRIEPPYVLLLIATWAFVGLTGYVPDGVHRFDVPPQSLTLSLAGSVVYAHGLVWGTFPRLFPPGWSLEVEVQFYLIAPLLFWLWARLLEPRARALLAAAFLALGVASSALDPKTVGPLHVEYSLLHFFNFFWLGIVLAYAKDWASERIARLPGSAATALGWSGLALCVLLPAPAQPQPFAEVFRLLGVYLGLAAVFLSTFAPRSGFRAFCARPWISLIGGACYSIYLVHLQVEQVLSSLAFKLAPGLPLAGVAATFAAAAVAVVVVGLIYYVAVERTFMARDWHLALWRALGGAVASFAPRRPAVAAAPEGAASEKIAKTPFEAQRRAARR